MIHFRERKRRRERMLRKMAAMRAAKARKRMERPPPEPEPKFKRWVPPLRIEVVDTRTGERGHFEFVSLRDAMRRLAVVNRHYV